jgi:hypothetical protein
MQWLENGRPRALLICRYSRTAPVCLINPHCDVCIAQPPLSRRASWTRIELTLLGNSWLRLLRTVASEFAQVDRRFIAS